MSDEDRRRVEDETPGVDEETPSDDASAFEEDFVDVDIMEASMTAFGTVSCDEMSATHSAIASASVAGDAELDGCIVGALSADGVAIRHGGAIAMAVAGDAAVSQGAAQLIVAKHADLESSGTGILVTGDATLARSWVGFMAARNAEITDGSRVIIDTRAGLIIGAFLFGGLGLLACAVYFGARRMAERMPHLPWAQTGHRGMHGHGRMPMHARFAHMQLADMPKLPDLPQIGEIVAKLRHAG